MYHAETMRAFLRFALAIMLIAAVLWWWRAPLQEAAQDLLTPTEQGEESDRRQERERERER
mgnify:CR=1 FL=1